MPSERILVARVVFLQPPLDSGGGKYEERAKVKGGFTCSAPLVTPEPEGRSEHPSASTAIPEETNTESGRRVTAELRADEYVERVLRGELAGAGPVCPELDRENGASKYVVVQVPSSTGHA
jgi:hypothetical protein